MVIKCEIKFDQNAYGLYFAGQILSGKVELNIDKPKKVQGICLKIAGNAQCSWSERRSAGSGKSRRTETIWYRGREDYVSTKTYFVGSDEGYQLELPAGLHTYNFSCALPEMLPSSFEGTYGHIRYTVRVVLVRPWKFDQSYRVAFTVLKPYDLNYDSPILKIPTQMETTKQFCCGPCRSGPFSLVATINQSGFVPGQTVKIYTEVTNMSNILVDTMKYFIRKIVTYNSQTPTTSVKEEIIILDEKRTNGVAKSDKGRFEVCLSIPSVPPTNKTLCKVIQISYDVKVEAKVSGPHTNPFVIIPITIGTIPLNDNITGLTYPANITSDIFAAPMLTQPAYNPNALTTVPTAPEVSPIIFNDQNLVLDSNRNLPIINSIPNNSTLTSSTEIPPPSYEESIFGNRKIEDEDDQHPIGQQLYTPRYPVYHFDWSSQQQPHTNENNSGDNNTNMHSQKLREQLQNMNV